MRIFELFTRAKLPAWAVILWEALQVIPDWKSRVDFWIDVAKGTSGFWSGVANVISLPYFNFALTATALIWLGLAGEPKKFVQRHPWLPYLGWAVFGIALAAVVSTIGAGYFEFRIKQEVGKRDNEIQQQSAVRPVYWHMTDTQKTALSFALDQVPENKRFDISIECLPDAGSRTYVEEFAKVLANHKWKVSANCFFSKVRPDLVGIYLAVTPSLVAKIKDKPLDESQENLKALRSILDFSQLSAQWASFDDDTKQDHFYLLIGNAP
jgi:hypothetical protein